ncbi:hypothetical protein JYK22_03690 [Nonomuraea sp. RK-328]|nr:hypothetical protein [Nonomuraea sp. RK-328]
MLYAVELAAATGDSTADGATEEQIAAAYQPWSNRSGDWSAPLSKDLSEYVAHVGVAAPITRRDLLQFLAAVGVVVAEASDGPTRYRRAPHPPRVEEVLSLSAERVAEIRRQDAFRRYTALAADLAAVAVWTPGSTVSATFEELSGRLLATEEEVREAIRHGVDRGLLGTSGEATFTALPRAGLRTGP